MDNDTKLLNLALDAGEIMLMSGAETYRVQDTMLRILSVSGREKIEALALSTMLIVSLPREEKDHCLWQEGCVTVLSTLKKSVLSMKCHALLFQATYRWKKL